MADELDPHAQLRRLAVQELVEVARLHRIYYDELLSQQFTPEQAFALVRDHHYLFTQLSLNDEAHPWLAASSEPQSSTGSVSSLRRPNTPER